MSFASNMQRVANNLILKYGEDAVLVQKTNLGYNPEKGENLELEEDFKINGKVSSYTKSEQLSPNVIVGDLKLTIRTDFDINQQDWAVKYAGKEYKIVDIEKTIAQNRVIIQKLQIRA